MDGGFCGDGVGKGVSSECFTTSKFFFTSCGINPDNLAALEDGYKTCLMPTGQ